MKPPLPLAFLALASCATVPPAQAEGPVAMGQTAYTNGLRVRPPAIVEDSRCPINVMRVWPGRSVVRSEIIGESWRRTLDLGLAKPQPVVDGAITLVAAAASKMADTPIDPRSYRFTFDFQGGL